PHLPPPRRPDLPKLHPSPAARDPAAPGKCQPVQSDLQRARRPVTKRDLQRSIDRPLAPQRDGRRNEICLASLGRQKAKGKRQKAKVKKARVSPNEPKPLHPFTPSPLHPFTLSVLSSVSPCLRGYSLSPNSPESARTDSAP